MLIQVYISLLFDLAVSKLVLDQHNKPLVIQRISLNSAEAQA